MDRELIAKIADLIFDAEEEMTFPKLLEGMESLGINTKGDCDFESRTMTKTLKNCIYWRNMSEEAVELLYAVDKFYNVTLQPYGFDNKGVKLYKEYYPDFPIFNHFLMDKMSPKSQEQFLKKKYLMPVHWVPSSKAKLIVKPK